MSPELFFLVYVSLERFALGAAELEHILLNAQAFNPSVGVTGMLLYDRGDFMQYLEGPAAGLGAVLARVRVASQHLGYIELAREPLARRQCPNWSMAFRSSTAFAMSDPRLQTGTLAHRPGELDIAPDSPGTLLLSRFWHRGRYAREF